MERCQGKSETVSACKIICRLAFKQVKGYIVLHSVSLLYIFFFLCMNAQVRQLSKIT